MSQTIVTGLEAGPGTTEVDENTPEGLKAVEFTIALQNKISPPRELPGVEGLLEVRRHSYGIPDTAFRVQAAFHKIHIHQIPDVMLENGTYGDSGILIPESVQQARKRNAPRGIIVSAGLAALDVLRSNGMDLGHIVTHTRIAPLRVEYDLIGGQFFYLLALTVGDVYGSEDTARAVAKRMLFVKKHMEGELIRHYYASREEGELGKPINSGSEE